MAKDGYAEELNRFKENERPDPVLVVAGNAQYVRMLIAWTNVQTQRKRKLSKQPKTSEARRWQWLWDNTRYSEEEFAATSAVEQNAFEEKLAALMGNRIIYPDGTINSFVRRYLHERVLKLLDAKRAKE